MTFSTKYAHDDYLMMLGKIDAYDSLDEEDYPRNVSEVCAVRSQAKNSEEEYVATFYYSDEIPSYTFVGDLSGKPKVVRNGWWLTPNNYLYVFDEFGTMQRMVQESEAAGVVLTGHWSTQEFEVKMYQKPFLGLAAKLCAWMAVERPTSIGIVHLVARLMIVMHCLVIVLMFYDCWYYFKFKIRRLKEGGVTACDEEP